MELDERVVKTDEGLLFRRVLRHDEGVYVCLSREHGFSQTLSRVWLDVLQGDTLADLLSQDNKQKIWSPCPAHLNSANRTPSRGWFKDVLQLIGPSNLPQVEQYCERVWCNEKLRRKHKNMMDKYRQAQEVARKTRVSKNAGERNRMPRDTHAVEWHTQLTDTETRVITLYNTSLKRKDIQTYTLLTRSKEVERVPSAKLCRTVEPILYYIFFINVLLWCHLS